MTHKFTMTDAAGPMLQALQGFPEQCQQASEIGRAFAPNVTRPDNIVLTGLGGSAIGAELLRAYATSRCPLPVTVNRSYDLPAFVGPRTLVVVCSYSGNTEETISAWQQARERGAQVLLFSTGGYLGAQAEEHGISWCRIPPGLQPRAALGLSFFPMLQSLSSLGLWPDVSDDIRETVALLKQLCNRYSPTSPDNEAQTLASHWQDRIPVIYGSHGVLPVVAYRWKCQINENAKGLAWCNEFPELNHNESVGWSGLPALNRSMAVSILASRLDPPRIQKRVALTQALVARQADRADIVYTTGQSDLAQAFSLIHLGDWASFYLALGRHQDPMEVRAIDDMKAELAKGE